MNEMGAQIYRSRAVGSAAVETLRGWPAAQLRKLPECPTSAACALHPECTGDCHYIRLAPGQILGEDGYSISEA